MNANNRVPIPAWGWLGGFGLILVVALIPGSNERFGDLSRIISAFGQNIIVAAGIIGLINLFLSRKLTLHFWRLVIAGIGLIIFSGRIDLSGLLWVILLGALLMTLFGFVMAIITKSFKGFLAPFKWLGKILGGGGGKGKTPKFDPDDQVIWAGPGGEEFGGRVEQTLGNGRIRVIGDDGIRRQLQPGDLEKI